MSQKKANKKRMAAWERYVEKKRREQQEEEATRQVASAVAFEKKMMGSSDDVVENIKETICKQEDKEKKMASRAVNIKEHEARMKSMKAFWVPGKDDAVEEHMIKPDMRTTCPASGRPLKMKDLIPLTFTRAPRGNGNEYIDPVSGDSLTNASRLVVLKPLGDVMLLETYNRVVKREGQYNGTPIDADDVIELVCGGTGFAAHDKDSIQASKYYALGSGQSRGQTAGRGNTTNALTFGN